MSRRHTKRWRTLPLMRWPGQISVTTSTGNSVYFNGGETRSVTEVQLPGGSASGGSNASSAAPITVAPVYHIYGMRDTDELRSVLNAQNDDLREAVLEIVNDNDTDNFRRGYA